MPELDRMLATSIGLIWGMLLLPVLLLGLAIPYAVLRVGDARNEKPDPQIGLKAALYFFFSLGILLILYGLTAIVVDLMVSERKDNKEMSPVIRTSLALILSGVVVSLFHLLLAKVMTNDSRMPATKRVFAGWRFAIHGLVVVTTLTVLLVLAFQKDFKNMRVFKTLYGILIVWVPSWALHMVLLAFYSRPLFTPERGRAEMHD